MSTLTVLHLSDAHIGHPSYGLDINLVLYPLLEDIRKQASHGLVPDLIIFSGDLVFGQLPTSSIAEQFQTAREFLAELTNGFSIPIFLVPGNHDVNRDKVEFAHQEWLEAYIADDGKIERDAREGTSTWRGILARQIDWADFVRSLPHTYSYELNDQTFIGRGTLETEFGRVNLIGFNTAWASIKELEQGALRIGPHQFKQAKMMRREMQGLVLAVGHHPPTWLHKKETSDFEKWLETETHLFLHGHEHDVWFRDYSGTHLRVAAGACYQGSGDENVYQWIKLDTVTKTSYLTLRTLNDKGGAVGWMPYSILRKTDDHGKADVSAPFRSETFSVPAVSSLESTEQDSLPPPTPALEVSQVSLADPHHVFEDGDFQRLDLPAFIRFLDEHLRFRWEPQTFLPQSGSVSIFWPVRLRSPTPIHAVQAFTAAGLSLKGAKVCLSFDDFGDVQYSGDIFAERVRNWWRSVGADPSSLEVEYFRDVLSDDRYNHLWRNIQRLLGESDFDLQHVLRLSKYLPPRLDEKVPLKDFAAKRPRKLLTPTLVWTALLRHWERNTDSSIITLGGWDEQILWRAWWEVVLPERDKSIGHLYNPELLRPGRKSEKPLHMEASPTFNWPARSDIVQWLRMDLQAGGEWKQPSRIIPWTLNGCVRLPAFVSGSEQEWQLGPYAVRSDEDLAKISDPNEIIDALAGASGKWFFATNR